MKTKSNSEVVGAREHKHRYIDGICLTCAITKVRQFIDFDPTDVDYKKMAEYVAEAQANLEADMDGKWAVDDPLMRDWLDNAFVSLTVTTYKDLNK